MKELLKQIRSIDKKIADLKAETSILYGEQDTIIKEFYYQKHGDLG